MMKVSFVVFFVLFCVGVTFVDMVVSGTVGVLWEMVCWEKEIRGNKVQ